jgi:hypothetical protein
MKKVLYVLILLFLFSSTITFSQEGNGVWTLNTNAVGTVYAMVIDPLNPNNIYSAGLTAGIFKSTNGGTSWAAVNTGLTYTAVQTLAISPSNPLVLYAGTNQGNPNSGIYVTTNGGANWTLKNNGIIETSIGVQAFAINPLNPSVAYAAIFDGLADAQVGVYKTTDAGNTWFPSNTGMDIKNVLTLAVSPGNPNLVLAGSSFNVTLQTGPSKIYISSDAGVNWTTATGLPTDPLAINPVRFITFSTLNPLHVFAGLFHNTTDGGGYFSTDGGNSWVKKWNGAPGDVGTLLRSGIIRPGTTNEVYVGLDRSTPTNVGVWKTTNGGDNWFSFNSEVMLDVYGIRALIFKDLPINSTIFAGVATSGGAGIYEYTMPPVPVELISFNASVNNGIVELSWITASELNNSGFYIERQRIKNSDWQSVGFVPGNGTTNEKYYYHFSDEPGSTGKYLYRLRQLNYDGTSDYSNFIEVEVLQYMKFALKQNYPNPFNPVTNFVYSIPSDEFVTLKIFNLLGSEIAVLISEPQTSGTYSVSFNGGELSSGVYFYTLTAGTFRETKKMILNK